MDRYEVPIDAHLAPLVDAARRGDEVVIVEDGEVVASVNRAQSARSGTIDDEFITSMKVHQNRVRALGIPPGDAAKLIREMRDEGD